MMKHILYERGIRIEAKSTKDYIGRPIIRIRPQVKKWYGWVNTSSSWTVDIEFCQKPLIDDERNPFRMDHEGGGIREVWADGTFDLKSRMDRLAKDIIDAMNRRDSRLDAMAKMVNNI